MNEMKTKQLTDAKQLEARLCRLNDELDEVANLCRNIETVAERLAGPISEETCPGPGTEEPQSYLSRLDDALDRLQRLRNQLAESVSRLEDAV